MSIVNFDKPMQLAIEYLEQRGITPLSIKTNCMEVGGKTRMMELLGRDDHQKFPWSGGIWIPAGGGDGNKGQVVWLGYQGMEENRKSYKSKMCTSGPADCNIHNMADFGKDDIYLCESPLKSLALQQLGYTAISGYGVWGLYNGKNGWVNGMPLDQMRGMKRAVILFDADCWGNNNKEILRAVASLTKALERDLPELEVVEKRIPVEYEEDKLGIDDYIVLKGADFIHEWLSEPGETAASRLGVHLEEIQETWGCVIHPPCVVDRRVNKYINVGGFKLAEQRRTYNEPRPGGGGGMAMERIQPWQEWLEWADRRTHPALVYVPGSATDLDEGYNLWVNDGIEGVEGDMTPFFTVYKNAIPDPAEFELLMDMAAWVVQKRGERLPKTVFLVGDQQGTGKSQFVKDLGACVGQSNWTTIGAEQFNSDFNSCFATKELVLLDDVDQLDKKATARLKRIVTSDRVMVNPKGVQEYEVDNYNVYFMTANRLDAIKLELENRRIVPIMFRPTVHHKGGSEWWQAYFAWLDNGGREALCWWLMQRDLSGFDPNWQPEDTEGMNILKDLSISPEEAWCDLVISDWDEATGGCLRSCFNMQELLGLYKTTAMDRDTGDGEDDRVASAVRNKFGYTHRLANGKGATVMDPATKKKSRYWLLNNRLEGWTTETVKRDIVNNKIGQM